MPFDFKKYDTKCAQMNKDELQRKWEHYTRLISGAATSTAVSGAAIPPTLGVSTIGVGLAAPAIHNARKKRDIIDRHLQRVGATHHTRKRDVLTPMAISGTIGVVTLGVSSVGTDVIVNHAAEHGMTYVAENELAVKIGTHLACDGIAVVGEEAHMKSKKEQESWKAYTPLMQQGNVPPAPPVTFEGPAVTAPHLMGEVKVDEKVYNYGLPSPATTISPPPSYSGPVPNYMDSYFSIPIGQHPHNQTYPPTPAFSQVPQYSFGPASPLLTPENRATRTGCQRAEQNPYDIMVTAVSRPTTPYDNPVGAQNSLPSSSAHLKSTQLIPANQNQASVESTASNPIPLSTSTTQPVFGHRSSLSTDSTMSFLPLHSSPTPSVASLPSYSAYQNTTSIQFPPPPPSSFVVQPLGPHAIPGQLTAYQQQCYPSGGLHAQQSSSISYTPVGQQEVHQAYRPYIPYGSTTIPPSPRPLAANQTFAHKLSEKQACEAAPSMAEVSNLVGEISLDIKNQHLYAAQSTVHQPNSSNYEQKLSYYAEPLPVYQTGGLDQKSNVQQSIAPAPAYQSYMQGQKYNSQIPYFAPPPTSC